MVKADNASYDEWIASSTITAVEAKGLKRDPAFVNGRMSIFNADGFTVRTDYNAKNTDTQSFAVFDTDLEVGSYNRINGIKEINLFEAFSPEMVWIFGDA